MSTRWSHGDQILFRAVWTCGTLPTFWPSTLLLAPQVCYQQCCKTTSGKDFRRVLPEGGP